MQADSTAIEPKKEDRLSYPVDFEKHPEFQKMIMYHKTFKWENYSRIRSEDDKTLIRIYTPHFAQIFNYPDYELCIGKSDKPVKVLTYPLYIKFKEGYLEGVKYFNETYKVSPDVIYGLHSQQYERTLHQKYYHPVSGKITGEWVHYEKSYPIVFNFEILFDYGYFSGIISCIKDLIKEHPVIFQNFDKCAFSNEHKKEEIKLIPTDPTLAKILNHLKPLKGYWRNEKILTDNDFSTLLNNIKFLLGNNALPDTIKQFPNTPIPNQFILKTFANINKEFFQRKRNVLFYELIQKSFRQFNETTLDSIKKKLYHLLWTLYQ
jgi:hypothetical protein